MKYSMGKCALNLTIQDAKSNFLNSSSVMYKKDLELSSKS